MDHLKKYQVNQAGGIMLSKDIAKYQDVINKWSVVTISESFELLVEIGNLFVVGYDTPPLFLSLYYEVIYIDSMP